MTAADIKRWLALVANAVVAARQAATQADELEGVDAYDVRRAADLLEQAFTEGLTALEHAAVREYQARQEGAAPAA